MKVNWKEGRNEEKGDGNFWGGYIDRINYLAANMNHFLLTNRGPSEKTDLSLVDKIELARTYQPLTGELFSSVNTRYLFPQMSIALTSALLSNMQPMWIL